jgi:aldehyde:ferredoxin oxidoreductase
VQNYVELFSAVTGREISSDDLVAMSEAVYNFQRVFNIRLGYGLREHDAIPYRSMGPATADEYEARAERYDDQLRDQLGLNPERMTLEQRMAALREHREKQYDLLTSAVYERRGWTKNGVPTLETLKRLGMDHPEVVAVVKRHL